MEIYDRLQEIVSKSKIEFNLIEIGACDGDDTVKMNRILEASGLPYVQIAIEPCRDNFRIMSSKLNGLNVFTLHTAVGQVDGTVEFHYSNNRKYYGSSSIRAPKESLSLWPDMSFVKMEMDCARLDTLANEWFWSGKKIDFIWADVQGAEIDLIAGGRETLARTRYLYTEYSDVELYEGEIKLDQILAMLPGWEIVEKYDHDVLLRNTKL